MFYALLKIYARIAIKVYCRRIIINRPEVLKSKGPLLLAANHPNSFLDGIILTTLFDLPVYSLARGDAFQVRWIDRILRRLRLLPVYRTSEGTENLEHNYTTFEACQKTFEENGIVLIFSEGKCENEWHLRPLKKGTARLATRAWQSGIPLRVVPVGFNYSSFKRFGKELHLFFGDPITAEDLEPGVPTGRQLIHFNARLEAQLHDLVYEIHAQDRKKVKKIFSIRKTARFYLLLVPAVAGWLLHAPLFYLCKAVAESSFKRSGHYDSVQTSLLLLLYPLYLLIAIVIAARFVAVYSPLALLILPFTAWASVQWKYEADI